MPIQHAFLSGSGYNTSKDLLFPGFCQADLLSDLGCTQLPGRRFLTCCCHLVASFDIAEQIPSVLEGGGKKINLEADGHEMAS